MIKILVNADRIPYTLSNTGAPSMIYLSLLLTSLRLARHTLALLSPLLSPIALYTSDFGKIPPHSLSALLLLTLLACSLPSLLMFLWHPVVGLTTLPPLPLLLVVILLLNTLTLGGTRTHNLLLRRQPLCLLRLRTLSAFWFFRLSCLLFSSY